MKKKQKKRLDFAQLRYAALEALSSFGEEGLVAYLKQQAQEKPNSFFNLLLKLAEEPEEDSNKVTKIEIVATSQNIDKLSRNNEK